MLRVLVYFGTPNQTLFGWPRFLAHDVLELALSRQVTCIPTTRALSPNAILHCLHLLALLVHLPYSQMGSLQCLCMRLRCFHRCCPLYRFLEVQICFRKESSLYVFASDATPNNLAVRHLNGSQTDTTLRDGTVQSHTRPLTLLLLGPACGNSSAP